MIALVRMRIAGYFRSGRLVAPLAAVFIVLGMLNGGGQTLAGEAYGAAVAFVFPVLAWQTKLLLDTEPDVQRRLARVAVGGVAREYAAGLIAAAVAALPLTAIALGLPWVFGAIRGPATPGEQALPAGIAFGVWALLILVPAAVALGGLASRAVTGSAGRGASILVAGSVFALVLGLRESPVPWLAPPVMATSRTVVGGASTAEIVVVSAWALLWATAAVAGYAALRRTRA